MIVSAAACGVWKARVSYLKERCVVEDDLWCGYPEVHDAVVRGSCRLLGAQGLFQVTVEGPELHAAVQPALHWTFSLSGSHCLHSMH